MPSNQKLPKILVFFLLVITSQVTAEGVNTICPSLKDSDFEKVVLQEDIFVASDLAISKKGDLFWAQISGEVYVMEGSQPPSRQIGSYPSKDAKWGLSSIELDPNFPEKPYLYGFVCTPNKKTLVLRYSIDEELNMIEGSRTTIDSLDFCKDPGGHGQGDLAFDGEGNLYYSFGFKNDEEANVVTKSHGKIHRITPLDEGWHTIPEGNMDVGEDGDKSIFMMGFRNPFRFSVDPVTGNVIVGDVGPDRGEENAIQADEFNVGNEPANFGWPECDPLNQPISNQGLGIKSREGECPDSKYKKPIVWYRKGDYPHFQWTNEWNKNKKTNAMGGPRYHYDPDLQSENKWPLCLDGTYFLYDWGREWTVASRIDVDNNKLLDVQNIAADVEISWPEDIEFGPDGALYAVEWGEYSYSYSQKTAIVRVDYKGPKDLPSSLEKPQGIYPSNGRATWTDHKLTIQLPAHFDINTVLEISLVNLDGKTIQNLGNTGIKDRRTLTWSLETQTNPGMLLVRVVGKDKTMHMPVVWLPR